MSHDLSKLAGAKLLVVGASSGIGRSVSLGAVRAGADVVVAARRRPLLAEVVAEASTGAGLANALVCDVSDPSQASELADRAAQLLGGLDVVVYAAGSSRLAPLSQTDWQAWNEVLATNLLGAATVVSSAIAHLAESGKAAIGRNGGLGAEAPPGPTVVLLSSHSVARPWPGLVPYAAAKAALDAFARGLRDEEPWLRVIDVAVTNTATGFADGWDPTLAGPAFERWLAGGYLAGRVLSSDEMAEVVLTALVDPDGPEDVVVVNEPVG